MPLDFTQAHAPPTLGKRRSKEEIKRALQKKYDVKAGLREQGGFTDIRSTFTKWDDKRREEYASIIARQDAQGRAQFGELPDGWSYMTDEEIEALLSEAKAGRNFYDRSIDKMPRITFSYQRDKMTWDVTAQQKPYTARALMSDEELFDASNVEDYVAYTVNRLIKRLAEAMLKTPGP